MNFAKLIAFLGMLSMGIALYYGFTSGSLNQDGAALLKMPWGVVSLVDVYVGFILFSGWIIYREKNILVAMVLVALVMIFGNYTASAYALWALVRSRGDWKKFWLGARV